MPGRQTNPLAAKLKGSGVAIHDLAAPPSRLLKAKQALLDLAVQGRTAAERRAAESEFKFRIVTALIEHIPFAADEAGSLTHIDREWEIKTGIAKQSAMNQGWMLALHPDELPKALGAWNDNSLSQGRVDFEARVRMQTGDYRWYRFRAAKLAYLDSGPATWYGTMEDVDERHKAALEHEQTQSALVHLSRLSAMGTMASTLAHELNQPLTAITNYIRVARICLRDNGESEVVDAIAGADSAALRAGEIVRRVRELVVSGQVDKRPIALNVVVQEVIDLLDNLIRTSDVVIEVIGADRSIPLVMADRIQIEQVLLNLVRNAIEAVTQNGTCQITIEVQHSPDNCCRMSVKDTGPGLSPSVAARIFQLFNTSKPGGSGIGLSICRTIIEAHGGKIWFVPHSTGTEIAFTIPCVAY